jgi:DNA-binding NarL/FixJ family response regulator
MRIIVADHHAQVLRALKLTLLELPTYDLVGEAANAESLLRLAGDQSAELILVDRELPGASIEDLIAGLHTLQPRPMVIVMGSRDEYGRRALRAGADAFVSKGERPEWLLGTLHIYAQRAKHDDKSG